jgi:hypothetical protein
VCCRNTGQNPGTARSGLMNFISDTASIGDDRNLVESGWNPVTESVWKSGDMIPIHHCGQPCPAMGMLSPH